MFKKISIATKIFGIAITMLLLLVIVVFINYLYLNRVNRELKEIAHYMVPLTTKITQIDVHSLVQKIHLEQILLLYEVTPLDKQQISKELDRFRVRTMQVERELGEAQQLSNQVIQHAVEVSKIVEYARLGPYLEILGKEYRDFIQHVLEIIRLLELGELREAHLLEKQLGEQEDNFNEQVEQILIRFENFVEQSARKAEEHEGEILELNLILTGVVTVIGILLAILLILGLTRPIQKLLVGTRQVEMGDLNTKVVVNSRDEIGALVVAFDKMVEGMRQKDQLKATFGQYVDPRIVNLLIESKKTGEEQSSREIATVFFSDIAGFSKISEMLTAKGLVTLINKYLTLASEPIIKNQGVVDKFIGDALVAFWGTPFTGPEEHAVLGCFSALEQSEQLRKFREMMPDLMGIRKGLPVFNVRIGIATSSVVAGHFGSKNSRSYTIMGDAMLVAEALETASKTYGTTILISEKTRTLALEHIETRRIDRIAFPHMDERTNIYELLGKKGEISEDVKELRTLFEQALTAYELRNWEKAQSIFTSCLQINRDDGPTQYYLKKMETKSPDKKKKGTG